MAGLLVKLHMHREKACDLGPDLHTSSSEIYAGSGVCRMKSSSLNICILSEIIKVVVQDTFNVLPALVPRISGAKGLPVPKILGPWTLLNSPSLKPHHKGLFHCRHMMYGLWNNIHNLLR